MQWLAKYPAQLFAHFAAAFCLLLYCMDKAGMQNMLQSLHLELTKRLADEQHAANDPEKTTEYQRQIQQIQTEIDRINTSRSYKPK